MHWWYLLNRAIFDNQLVPPRRIEIRNFHNKVDGWCEGCAPNRKSSDEVVIGIKRKLPNRATFIWILAHEMVHQWEWQVAKRMAHGQNFHQWSDKVRDITGAPLNEYTPTL